MTSPYYRPSGRVPASAYPIAMLAFAGLLPLAWLYAWLIIHAPFVFDFFIAFAFSFAVGSLTKLVVARGKVRNLRWIGRAGIVLGMAGWYLQWAAWIALTVCALGRQETAGVLTGTFVTLVTQPWMLVGFAIDLLATGTTSLFGWQIKGAWLAAVWLIELWMHLMLPPLLGRMRAEQPFCEATNAWAEKMVVERYFQALDPAQSVPRLETNPHALSSLLMPSPSEESADHAEVTLYRTGGTDGYVSITNVFVSVDGKGQTEGKHEPVVEYLRLPDTDVDALFKQLTLHAACAGQPVAPVLAGALEALQAERYAEAIDAVASQVASGDPTIRADARRICALACSRLARWDAAAGYFASLFEDEPTAHNALQTATSSVMAGALPEGLSWIGRAAALNATSGELPHMTLLTSFVTALKGAGHEAAAMPFIDQIRQAYTDVGSTDPTILFARSMPFFSAFLSNSLQFVRAAMEPEQGRSWYAHMLPSLDPAGQAELREWLDNQFGSAPSPG